MHLIQCHDLGITLRVTQGFRTYEEQKELYAQGRTKPGKRVTNADAGRSWHNYGLAYDVVPLVNGIPDWNNKKWEIIGSIGEQNGLVWGGRWKGIKVDRPHFEWHPGLTIDKALALYQPAKDLAFVWDELS